MKKKHVIIAAALALGYWVYREYGGRISNALAAASDEFK